MGMNVNIVGKDSEDSKLGKGDVEVTYNSLSVRPLPGPQTATHNRQLIDTASPADPTVVANVETARESVTWTAVENITEVTVVAIPSGGTDAAVTKLTRDLGIWVTFDAPSDAVASNWLTEAVATATDTNRYYVPFGSPRTFRFTDNITRADAITANDGTGPTDVTSIIVFEAN